MIKTNTRIGGWCAVVATVGVFTACTGKDPTQPTFSDLSPVFARAEINHRAVVMSIHPPYDTVQLQAIARNVQGDLVEGEVRVTFRRQHMLDTSLAVDANGLVHARMQTPGSAVIAEVTVNGITRADTAIIMVRTEQPITMTSRLEFTPLLPDSAWRWAGSLDPVPYRKWVRAYGPDNDTIPLANLVVSYDLGNRSIFASTSLLDAFNKDFRERSAFPSAFGLIGETWLKASVYAYGVRLSDSMKFRRIEPPLRFVVVDRVVRSNGDPSIVFYPSSIEISPGTTVAFLNRWGLGLEDPYDFGEYFCFYGFCGSRITHSAIVGGAALKWVDSTDVRFDGPVFPSASDSYSNVKFFTNLTISIPIDTTSGNISAFSAVTGTFPPLDEGIRARKFTVPGTYRFSSSRYPGAGGSIIVRN